MKIIGLILAGGRATRMGGVDKGLVDLGGTPLVLHAYRILRPQVDAVAVSANRSRAEYERILPPGTAVLADLRSGFPGPPCGLEAVLGLVPEDERKATLVATVPCDTPALPRGLVAELLSSLGKGDAAVAAAGGSMQPTIALVRATCLDSLTRYLDSGGSRVRAWYREIGAAYAEFDDVDSFMNCNTAEDLALALKFISDRQG